MNEPPWQRSGCIAPSVSDLHSALPLGREGTGLGRRNSSRYFSGRFLGPKVFRWEGSRLFNRAALDKTHSYYERFGGRTIIIARFVPLVRTFAPFVAGVGTMPYPRFIAYSVAGALLWVISLVTAGYFFGNVPVVKENLTLVIFAIIGLSVAPIAIELVRSRLRRASESL
jgi:membrane-associated protein